MKRTWEFGTVRFYLDTEERYARTTFSDGTCVHTRPQPGEDLRYWFRHDFSHNFLARALGLEHSETLYDVAHGNPSIPAHFEEESSVIAFCRFLIDPYARRDPALLRLAELVDIGDLRRNAIALLNMETT